MDVKQKKCDTLFQTIKNQVFSYPEIDKTLSKLSLFERVKRQNGMVNFKKIMKKITQQKYQAGDIIYQRSTTNRKFFYILAGSISIQLRRNLLDYNNINIQDYGKTQQTIIKKLEKNQYFGDKQYIEINYCIIKAVALENTTIYSLPLSILYQAFKGVIYFPQITERLKIISKANLFKNIDKRILEKLAWSAENIKVLKNSQIYEQDTTCSFGYLVVQGQFQLIRKIYQNKINSPSTIRFSEIDILTVSKFQTLGMEQILLHNNYTDSAYCRSVYGQLLKIDKDKILNSINVNKSKILKLCKNKEDWKNNRIQMFQRTFTSHFQKSQSRQYNSCHQKSQNRNQIKTEGDYSELNYQIQKSHSKTSSITNRKKSQIFRNEKQYFEYKINCIQKRKNDKYKNIFEIIVPKQMSENNIKPSKNLSQLLYQKFMNKKQKIQNRIILDYLNAKPPQLVFNPQKQFSIVKPLYIKQSQAILNKKKTILQIKRKFFKPVILMNQRQTFSTTSSRISKNK